MEMLIVEEGKLVTSRRPEQAEPLIEYFIECLKASGLRVQTGIFRADMNVQLINHGPATLMIEVN